MAEAKTVSLPLLSSGQERSKFVSSSHHESNIHEPAAEARPTKTTLGPDQRLPGTGNHTRDMALALGKRCNQRIPPRCLAGRRSREKPRLPPTNTRIPGGVTRAARFPTHNTIRAHALPMFSPNIVHELPVGPAIPGTGPQTRLVPDSCTRSYGRRRLFTSTQEEDSAPFVPSGVWYRSGSHGAEPGCLQQCSGTVPTLSKYKGRPQDAVA